MTDVAVDPAAVETDLEIPKAISWLIHGASKCGKSTLADTSPAPRLHLDAEGGMGTRFTSSRKKLWDPKRQKPPVADGTWDTCVVYVRSYDDVKFTYDWLNSGQHPFLSVTLDSVSEIQQRAVDAMVGKDAMKTQDWGTLLRDVSAQIRQFRDLCAHPTHPLSAVVMIAMTKKTDDKWRPYVQGQLADRLPYYVDICGYLYVDQTSSGDTVRKLLVVQHPMFEAGERVGNRLGDVVTDPNISNMIDQVFKNPIAAVA